MRMQYVLKPLALSALALGLLVCGTPAVQAAQDSDAPQGYRHDGNRGQHDRDRREHRNDRKNHDNDRRDHMDRRHQDNDRRDHMDRRHDNRSDQGERMGKPRYDKDRGDRRSPRGDQMGRPEGDRGARNGQMGRSQGDMRQGGQQRPADRSSDGGDVRN